MAERRKWKRKMLSLSLALLLGAAEAAGSCGVALASSSTREEINKTEGEKEQLENELDRTNDNLTDLRGEHKSLQLELKNLNTQLTAVVAELEQLEQQIGEKEQKIAETQEALAEARATEEWQYNSIVAMMRCMYEMQDDSYVAALMSAGSLSELLNRAGQIEKVVAYSQQKMREFKENRRLIEEQEAKLFREREELEGLKLQSQEQRDKVAGLIEQTADSVAQYADEIEEAERKAREYEAEIKKKEEDLATLKKKLAEEIALSQAASNGVWRDISEVTFAEGDRYLLANLIYCEAGAEPYAGQVAVGSVVINRVLSSKFPDTVVGVIYQNRQFSPVASGRLELALATNRATADCYRAADEAMSGVTNVGSCVFFRTPIEGLSGISIGGHIFY